MEGAAVSLFLMEDVAALVFWLGSCLELSQGPGGLRGGGERGILPK
jgi:hypothetical protein